MATYLTPEQVAEMLQISPKSVYRWASQDASMPVTRLGRVVRFEEQALARWLKNHSTRQLAPVSRAHSVA